MEIEKLRDRARELDWLLEDLKLSPVADPPLLGLAERLVRLSPDDVQAQRLAAELRSRFEASPSDRRSAALPWAPPRTYRYGFPVQALAGLQRIACSAAAEAEWRKSPGRFFVACGLALQGLDQAAISINLRPSPKTSLLRKLTLLKRTSPTAAWGLDLGTTGLRAAHLTYDRQRSAVILDAVQTIEYRRSLTTVPDEAEQRQLKKEALVQFAARNSWKANGSASACPASRRWDALWNFRRSNPRSWKKRSGGRRVSNFPWTSRNWPGDISCSRARRRRLGNDSLPRRLQAVKQYVVDNLVHLGEEAGLPVDVVQSECLALHNLAVYEFFGGDQRRRPNLRRWPCWTSARTSRTW